MHPKDCVIIRYVPSEVLSGMTKGNHTEVKERVGRR